MQTPYYLIHEQKLKANIDAFRTALAQHWPCYSIAYSVKTNSLPWVLEYMKAQGVLAEVVSAEEYELAQRCGYSPDMIVYNGPIKTETSLRYALAGKSFVNLDSAKDLDVLCTCEEPPEHVGIRVNTVLADKCPEDIDYLEDGFRFGFSYETGTLKDTIRIINGRLGDIPLGLHLHCNSKTRSLKVYRALASTAASIISKYSLNITYIDIGGGFFGGVHGKTTPEEYIRAIYEELCDVVDCNKVRLIIEPGSALIGSVADLVTSVLDVKDTQKARIVTTDGSRLHLDPLWIKSSYMYSLSTDAKAFQGRQIICGYTCMDHDRIMSIEDRPELAVGDRVIYHRVGAYTMTLGGPFIRYYPDVYVQTDGEILKVRSRMTVEEYFRIQTCENSYE